MPHFLLYELKILIMNASDITYYLAKLGKLIGQNNMKGGLKVLIGGSALGGAAFGRSW